MEKLRFLGSGSEFPFSTDTCRQTASSALGVLHVTANDFSYIYIYIFFIYHRIENERSGSHTRACTQNAYIVNWSDRRRVSSPHLALHHLENDERTDFSGRKHFPKVSGHFVSPINGRA